MIGRSLARSFVLVCLFAGAAVEVMWTRPRTREARARWLHRFARRGVRWMGVRVEVRGAFPDGGAVVANHTSYLDIVVLAALHPCVFVSKTEIQRWPVLGWMTTMAGTVYVARGRGGSAAEAGGGIGAAVEAGLPVVFFPEGTTTNGEAMLPFRSGLLGQALLAQMPVTAAAVRYRLEGRNPAWVRVGDDVAYWGDAVLLPHLFRFLGLRGVVAEVRFAAEPIRFQTTERKLAAVEARAAVEELLRGER